MSPAVTLERNPTIKWEPTTRSLDLPRSVDLPRSPVVESHESPHARSANAVSKSHATQTPADNRASSWFPRIFGGRLGRARQYQAEEETKEFP